MKDIFNPDSVYYIKIMICYVMDKCYRRLTQDNLCDIVVDSGVINYFLFNEAIKELIENESIKLYIQDDIEYCRLTQKGHYASEYYELSIPIYFRRPLLNSTIRFFAQQDLDKILECRIEQTNTKACYLICRFKEELLDLMEIKLYAPDLEQAKFMQERISVNPVAFYRSVINHALTNTEERAVIEN